MKDIWQYFFSKFKDHDEVIAITDEDEFVFGQLRCHDHYAEIGDWEIDWDSIVFIAHDGFPCKALKSKLSRDDLERLDLDGNRQALQRLAQAAKHKVLTVVVGDPFVFEDVILEAGWNIGSPYSYTRHEETFILSANAGQTIGMLSEPDGILELSVCK
jgi:hypothetical protein